MFVSELEDSTLVVSGNPLFSELEDSKTSELEDSAGSELVGSTFSELEDSSVFETSSELEETFFSELDDSTFSLFLEPDFSEPDFSELEDTSIFSSLPDSTTSEYSSVSPPITLLLSLEQPVAINATLI